MRRPPAFLGSGQSFFLDAPEDFIENRVILPFNSANPELTVGVAISEKLRCGFTTAPDAIWVCKPDIYYSNQDYAREIGLSVEMNFLEGVYRPPAGTPVEEILEFRNARCSERQAFFSAIRDASNQIDVHGHFDLTLNVDVGKIEEALADLNRTTYERWRSAEKKEFRFEVRPSSAALVAAGAAVVLGNNPILWALALATYAYGAIKLQVNLTPKLEQPDPFAQAMTFAWEARREFPPFTRFPSE